ncbi:hypothetical protein VTK26DRAFT_4951 [Humicola hyalothermophila]
MVLSLLEQIMILCVASRVWAHNSYVEIPGYDPEVLLALSGSGPICWAGLEYSSIAQKQWSKFTWRWECENGECDSAKKHAWTHSTPCFQLDDSDRKFCVFTDANFADGRGISLITTPQRAAFVAAAPAFIEPRLVRGLNQDLLRTTPPKYNVRPVPGKGMGVVATAPIRRGELIMANTASYMVDYAVFNGLSREQYTLLESHAVDHLPPAHREAILALSPLNTFNTTDTANLNHTDLIDKITATNMFDIDPEPSDADQYHSFASLFPHIARLNHDCRPNAEYRFSYPLLAQLVHAARDIQPGEEITISYLDPLQTRAARTRRLRDNWGFECSCPACVPPPSSPSSKSESGDTAESDARITEILDLRSDLLDRLYPDPDEDDAPSTPASAPAPTAASPSQAERLIELYTRERLWTGLHEAYAFAALEYSAAGDEGAAIRYARLAVEWGLPMVGPDDEGVREMGRLLADPRAHWSWMRGVGGGVVES